MYTTTPSNWPKAVAQRLQERHSPPRPPTIYCTDSPREWGCHPAPAPGMTLTAQWGSPGEAALKLGPLGVVGDAGAAARASSGRISAQRGALNEAQFERRATAILAALDFAQRPMTNGKITAASGRRDLNHHAMAYALAKLIQTGRIVAARHGTAGRNWYSLPAWGPDRRLPDPGVQRPIPDSELARSSTRMLRALWESGYPMTNAAIALAAGVPGKRVGAYLKPLLERGTILRSGERGRYLYSLPAQETQA